MTIAIAIYTFIPPLADLATDTHVFHPGWLPHARMHTVWMLGMASGIGLVSLTLLWKRRLEPTLGGTLAGVLSLVVYGAFFLSAATLPLYSGALSDMEGGIGKGPFGFDANLFTFSVGLLVLLAGWMLHRRAVT
ncbi:MAG: hypothetical protein HKN19_03705 [Halioglobus sp.]|nr:hypothetical protein [Halioglobus sp.]